MSWTSSCRFDIFIQGKVKNKKIGQHLVNFHQPCLSGRILWFDFDLINSTQQLYMEKTKKKSEVDGWWKVSEYLPQKEPKKVKKNNRRRTDTRGLSTVIHLKRKKKMYKPSKRSVNIFAGNLFSEPLIVFVDFGEMSLLFSCLSEVWDLRHWENKDARKNGIDLMELTFCHQHSWRLNPSCEATFSKVKKKNPKKPWSPDIMCAANKKTKQNETKLNSPFQLLTDAKLFQMTPF